MKRILFVDDESELLNSLRARLHKHRHEWQMVFVNSGAGALNELRQQPVDLVVTDVRMPGMDGQQLLTAIKTQWPQTIRIVLSGYTEQLQLLNLVSLAHQYVSKPHDAQQLENMIERCFNLRTLLQAEHLLALVGGIGSLPAMPKVYAQLQQALAEPTVSTGKIADIIAHDPAIAAKVLQVANSAFFRLPKPVRSIKDAVMHLGFGSIRNLVMSAEIFSKWRNAHGPLDVDVEKLQLHALTTAAACAALAAGTALADDAWLAGLVHDIGYWILIQEAPQQLNRAMQQARDHGISSFNAEQQVLGATHAEVGAYLLGLWGLPYPLIEAVAFHHTPASVPQLRFELLGMLCTAHSLLAEGTDHSLLLSDEANATIDESHFLELNPPFNWQEARRRVESVYTTPLSLSHGT